MAPGTDNSSDDVIIKSMRLIVAGSRGFDDYEKLCSSLDFLTSNALPRRITVISGTARGADQLGERWAESHGHEVIRMPADWNRYGKSAGYRRNEEMAKVATHCVCFWDGKSPGTKHMIDLAKKHNVDTRVVQV